MSLVHNKVLGKLKERLNSQIIEKFIGLRSKFYAYKTFDGKEAKKAKDIKRNVVQKKICFDDLKNCLLTNEPIYIKQNLFRTINHDIYTVEQSKQALSTFDDKRFILYNGVNTLARGQYKLNKEKGNFLNYLLGTAG
jgi:hypothetical protein